jgi:uncharacterized protein (DUF362 family)
MGFSSECISRRKFLIQSAAGTLFWLSFPSIRQVKAATATSNPIFWIWDIPEDPFVDPSRPNRHKGIDALLHWMGMKGLKFYRSNLLTTTSGPWGMIETDDVVLIKVNAQWKYRGCTNSDLIRGLIQRIREHPGGFRGEVVIIENGQGRGSLNCDTKSGYPDGSVQANANDTTHSFVHLVDHILKDSRVSYYLLDSIRNKFIGADDHVTDGYRTFENVSYPCFTTKGGHRVELREGIWQGNGYTQNLKLINVPVLKHHDEGGSEITESLKHFYGILSMVDGHKDWRHYTGLGRTCGKMVVSIRTPILNIVDAIWASHLSLKGYPSDTTIRTNQIMASQDPVALDYCAAKYILYPIDKNPRHHPQFSGVNRWLTDARTIINGRGGIYNPYAGILVHKVTKTESEMLVFKAKPAV